MPINNHLRLVVLGVIALRAGDQAAAQQAFAAALTEADHMFAQTPGVYAALDTKGLALCGLMLCDGMDRVAAASQAYRQARALTQAPGIIQRTTVRSLEALIVNHLDGRLSPVQAAARGDGGKP